MKTCDVVSADQLTSDWNCMGNAVIFQYSIDLPLTDNPLIGEKVVVSNVLNQGSNQKRKPVPVD